jgi:pyruvate ferredoxin oxidoreductase gamma subunit
MASELHHPYSMQIRIHGRGGQGVVSAAEMLSIAALLEGRYAQAFPSFGSERMGAPVMAFCRIDDHPTRLREPVMHPDVLIIQDPTLLHQAGLFDGLDPSGYVLINSTRGLNELGIAFALEHLPPDHACAMPATELAMRYVGRPLPNGTLLGGFAAMTGALKLESVLAAIRSKFPGKVGESNVAAAEAAYGLVAHRGALEEVHV